MSQPAPYTPVTSFVTYQAQQSWFPGPNIDVELNNLKTTTDQIRANLALIQRDDGKLANCSVDTAQLSDSLKLRLGDTTTLAQIAASVAAAASSATSASASQTAAAASATAAASSAASAAASVAALSATSTTSLAIGTGAKTFTTQSGKLFVAGQFLQIASNANANNYMHGTVTSYSGTSLVMNITDVGGSGTKNDWNISISGPQGAAFSGMTLSDAYFGSGRPWADVRAWGAVGDGVTNDTTAIQNAINALAALGTAGGILWVPPGAYYVPGGLTTSSSASIRIMGASTNASYFTVAGTDVTVLSLNGPYSSLENISIYGKGYGPDLGTFGASGPALDVGVGGSIKISNVRVRGGNRPVRFNGTIEPRVYDCDFAQGYADACLYAVNSVAAKLHNCSFDQAWPISTPTAPLTISAWTSSHAYSVGAVVSTGGYYIQCKTAGTSGGSAPALKNYGVDITDGSAVWRLVCNTLYTGLTLDSGCVEFFGDTLDFSGCYPNGVVLQNSLATTGPIYTHINGAVISTCLSRGIHASAGSELTLLNSEIAGLVGAGSIGVNFAGSFANAKMSMNSFKSMAYGVAVNSGSRVKALLNEMDSCTAAAFYLVGGQSDCAFSYNDIASTCAIGLLVDSGAGDNITFLHNDNKATTLVSDASTGTNKAINASVATSRFSAHKNGTDQTGVAALTNTQVTFGTEAYDYNSKFASNAWTPDAGPVRMTFACYATGTFNSGDLAQIMIFKNGSLFKLVFVSCNTSQFSGALSAEDIANGTDVYTAYVYCPTASGTYTVKGVTYGTYFTGARMN